MIFKKFTNNSLIILSIMTLLGLNTANAQVGIGTISPDASAQLELQSSEKGFLPPRMDSDARDGIGSPAEGLTIYNTDQKCLNVYVGLGWRNLCAIVGANDVVNPQTGKIWMDRNLGASQVATSSTDADAYGDLYQWGRAADGHEKLNSDTYDGTSVRPNTNTESGTWDGKFITLPNGTNRDDWITTKTDNAWNTGTTVNPIKTATDPCPSGYRVPTEPELDAERSNWSSNDTDGAFASPLKLPAAGLRNHINGGSINVGTYGYYWSSTARVENDNAWNLYFTSSDASISSNNRAIGFSVRCIKD